MKSAALGLILGENVPVAVSWIDEWWECPLRSAFRKKPRWVKGDALTPNPHLRCGHLRVPV